MPVILRPAKLVLFKVMPFAKTGAERKVTVWSLISPATYNSASSTPPTLANTLGSPIPSLSTLISKISAESLIKPNFFHLLSTYTWPR